MSIDLDSATAELIAWEGKRIKEGDCVSTLLTRVVDDQPPGELAKTAAELALANCPLRTI